MSVDTRTPRSGFDDQPALSMVKVHCDPAQVIVNHASFRVRLAPSPSPRPVRAGADTARVPAAGRRRAPVVWTGRSAPGDAGATGLLQAVRNNTALATAEREYASGYGGGYDGAGTTQVIPRVGLSDDTEPTPGVTTAPPDGHDRPLLPPIRQAVGAYDTTYDTAAYGTSSYGSGHDTLASGSRNSGSGHGPSYGPSYGHEPYGDELEDTVTTAGRPQRHGNDAVRHAYYPGRRMNLGVVLLPLRVFLGFISIYAGMGKLCDPVYFDGGERGSMVKWLNSLSPWALAEPLRDFALSHPVGAGLTVAFLQVVVGVLTVLGLWQRVAASIGALLSAALIVTVSWRTVPAYDAPDIIYLAAWSPLIIAGAPVYSVDGRLASEAWRKLGPRSQLWQLRQRVLRRGALVATVVVGMTLLLGSVLGGAVRSSDMVTVPGPNQDPTNHLPGSALTQDRPTGGRTSSGPSGAEDRPTPSASRTDTPEKKKSTPSAGTVRESGRIGDSPRESQTRGTSGGSTPDRSTPAGRPSSSSGPSSSGGTGGS
ncbi:DoxX family membrane protein, partial [Streptomyces sp. NPDC004726]